MEFNIENNMPTTLKMTDWPPQGMLDPGPVENWGIQTWAAYTNWETEAIEHIQTHMGLTVSGDQRDLELHIQFNIDDINKKAIDDVWLAADRLEGMIHFANDMCTKAQGSTEARNILKQLTSHFDVYNAIKRELQAYAPTAPPPPPSRNIAVEPTRPHEKSPDSRLTVGHVQTGMRYPIISPAPDSQKRSLDNVAASQQAMLDLEAHKYKIYEQLLQKTDEIEARLNAQRDAPAPQPQDQGTVLAEAINKWSAVQNSMMQMPKSLNDENQILYGNTYPSTMLTDVEGQRYVKRPPLYGNFETGLTQALANMNTTMHAKKPVPLTVQELYTFNEDIEGSAWLLRVTRRTVQANPGDKYDTPPPTSGAAGSQDFRHWCNMTYFPVVAKAEKGNMYGYFVTVVYSSFMLNAQQLQHQPNYSMFPVVPGVSVYLDATYLANDDARNAVISAMLMTRPANGSVISFCIAVPFEGASCGLATALAIMGAPPLAATGFVRSTDPKKEDDLVEHIDHIDVKAILAIRDQYPLICPSKDVLGNTNQILKNYEHNVYSSSMYNTGTTEFKYDPIRHYLILATTLTESALLACHVWACGYESRPDVAVLRNKMLVTAVNWEAQRNQLVDSTGGINKMNVLKVLNRPFLAAPAASACYGHKLRSNGRFPDPPKLFVDEDDQPSRPLTASGAYKKPPPKKKRGR